jgi:hypothetical protein
MAVAVLACFVDVLVGLIALASLASLLSLGLAIVVRVGLSVIGESFLVRGIM